MAEYEFSREHEPTFETLARRVSLAAILIALAGVAGVGAGLQTWMVEGPGFSALRSLLSGLVGVGIGVVLWLPADNLKRIATTQGRDESELLTALGELSRGFGLVRYLIILAVVAFILSLFWA